MAEIDHDRGGRLLAKHLQTTNAIGDDLDLIFFQGERPPQNFPRSTIFSDE
jgi:hypothetical protein